MYLSAFVIGFAAFKALKGQVFCKRPTDRLIGLLQPIWGLGLPCLKYNLSGRLFTLHTEYFSWRGLIVPRILNLSLHLIQGAELS